MVALFLMELSKEQPLFPNVSNCEDPDRKGKELNPLPKIVS